MFALTFEKGDQKATVVLPHGNIYGQTIGNLGIKVRNFRFVVFNQHFIISRGRVSLLVTVLLPSRHDGRGGVIGEEAASLVSTLNFGFLMHVVNGEGVFCIACSRCDCLSKRTSAALIRVSTSLG